MHVLCLFQFDRNMYMVPVAQLAIMSAFHVAGPLKAAQVGQLKCAGAQLWAHSF